MRALYNYQMSLMKPAEHKRVQLMLLLKGCWSIGKNWIWTLLNRITELGLACSCAVITGWADSIENPDISNWTRMGKVSLRLFWKNYGTTMAQMELAKTSHRSIYRTLPYVKSPIQTGTGTEAHLWNVPWNKWNSHIQLLSFGCSKASSLTMPFLEDKWLSKGLIGKILDFRTVKGFNITKMGNRP